MLFKLFQKALNKHIFSIGNFKIYVFLISIIIIIDESHKALQTRAPRFRQCQHELVTEVSENASETLMKAVRSKLLSTRMFLNAFVPPKN